MGHEGVPSCRAAHQAYSFSHFVLDSRAFPHTLFSMHLPRSLVIQQPRDRPELRPPRSPLSSLAQLMSTFVGYVFRISAILNGGAPVSANQVLR